MHEPTDPVAQLVAVLEGRIAPALERIALALERGGPAVAVAEGGLAEAAAAVRRAIRDGALAEARTLLDDFVGSFPEAPEAEALAEDLAGAGQRAVADLRSRLDAAQKANDPDAVLGFRDALSGLLDVVTLAALDRDVLAWTMRLLMKRLRGGTVRPDVAALAARVAETFPGHAEGASLRASLPTLRRSAGLCPRCAAPYAGVEDACPLCLSNPPGMPAPAPEAAPST